MNRLSNLASSTTGNRDIFDDRCSVQDPKCRPLISVNELLLNKLQKKTVCHNMAAAILPNHRHMMPVIFERFLINRASAVLFPSAVMFPFAVLLLTEHFDESSCEARAAALWNLHMFLIFKVGVMPR